MDFEKKSVIIFLLRCVFYCTLLCYANSCKNELSSEHESTINGESDSTLTLIKASNDTDNTISDRHQLLLKALDRFNEEEEDSTKLVYISKIQYAYLKLGDSISFRQTNKKSIKLALQFGDSLRLAGRYWDLAHFFEKNKVKDSAYYYYTISQKIYAQKNQFFDVGRILLFMAKIQMEVKDYTGAEINAFRAIKLLKPLNKSNELYEAYNLLGIITKDLKEYERSLAYYEEARIYLNMLDNNKYTKTQSDNNLGNVHKEMGDYKKAITYFENTLKQDSLLQKKPSLYAKTLSNLAQSQFKLNPNADVKLLFERALKIRDSIGDFTGMAASHYFLAEYHLSKNDTIHALSNAMKAKEYAEQSDNNERLLEALGLLIHIDRKNGSTHTNQYIRLNDSLHIAERQIRDKFTRIQFETDEVVAENVILAKEKQFWAGIAVALLLLGLSIYMIADQRIKNQKLRFQEQQQTNNQEIFNLMLSQSQKLEEGKKMEQKRISEELHDGVLGKMLGARMLLTGLNKKSDTAAITQRSTAIEALKNVEGEVRSISHELSHAAYQKIHNFISSIQDLMDGIGQNAQIDCSFTYSNNLDWDGLSGDIKINVYRIIQECLQNTVKHAVCKNVRVDFEAKGENLKIQITDDGKGFEFKKVKKGIGIRNIKSRVLKLNGTWRANSTIGNGTTIIINIPIKYYTNAMELKENGVTLNKA